MSSLGRLSASVGRTCLALALAAGSATGQTARLQGVVLDEATWSPVPSATLSLVGRPNRTESLANGSFAFADVPPGTVAVRVEAPGYTSIVQEVQVRAGRIAFVQFAMVSVSAVLDEILVTGRSPRDLSAVAEPRTAADLLAGRIPGVTTGRGSRGDETSRMQLRGVGSFTRESDPAVFVDGVRLAGGLQEALSLLRQIPASDVRDIEILRGPAAAFLQGAANGAIRVWTVSGAR
jgi:iron complex outermembrane receptor protein